jgi:hypothetical protein
MCESCHDKDRWPGITFTEMMRRNKISRGEFSNPDPVRLEKAQSESHRTTEEVLDHLDELNQH